jgi:hypothetical protein
MSCKGSFDVNRLELFTKEYGIKLIDSYNYVTRDTLVSGICKNNDCNNNFKKNFRTLIKNNSAYIALNVTEDCSDFIFTIPYTKYSM